MNKIKHIWLYYIRKSPSYRMQFHMSIALEAMYKTLKGEK